MGSNQWLFRTGLVGVSMYATYKACSVHLAFQGMKEIFALEHSLMAEAFCPTVLNLDQLKQVHVCILITYVIWEMMPLEWRL